MHTANGVGMEKKGGFELGSFMKRFMKENKKSLDILAKQ